MLRFVLLLASVASIAFSKPQFGGPEAALGVIANLCGSEPPFACKCEEESNPEDSEDIGNSFRKEW